MSELSTLLKLTYYKTLATVRALKFSYLALAIGALGILPRFLERSSSSQVTLMSRDLTELALSITFAIIIVLSAIAPRLRKRGLARGRKYGSLGVPSGIPHVLLEDLDLIYVSSTSLRTLVFSSILTDILVYMPYMVYTIVWLVVSSPRSFMYVLSSLLSLVALRFTVEYITSLPELSRYCNLARLSNALSTVRVVMVPLSVLGPIFIWLKIEYVPHLLPSSAIAMAVIDIAEARFTPAVAATLLYVVVAAILLMYITGHELAAKPLDVVLFGESITTSLHEPRITDLNSLMKTLLRNKLIKVSVGVCTAIILTPVIDYIVRNYVSMEGAEVIPSIIVGILMIAIVIAPNTILTSTTSLIGFISWHFITAGLEIRHLGHYIRKLALRYYTTPICAVSLALLVLSTVLHLPDVALLTSVMALVAVLISYGVALHIHIDLTLLLGLRTYLRATQLPVTVSELEVTLQQRSLHIKEYIVQLFLLPAQVVATILIMVLPLSLMEGELSTYILIPPGIGVTLLMVVVLIARVMLRKLRV